MVSQPKNQKDQKPPKTSTRRAKREFKSPKNKNDPIPATNEPDFPKKFQEKQNSPKKISMFEHDKKMVHIQEPEAPQACSRERPMYSGKEFNAETEQLGQEHLKKIFTKSLITSNDKKK